jgi:hypothetical protein
VDRLGEFQEVVENRLRHSSAGSSSDSGGSDSADGAAASRATASDASSSLPATATPVASSSSSGSASQLPPPGIRSVLVSAGNGSGAAAAGQLLLELMDLSITTPGGQLSLVSHLDVQVRALRCFGGGAAGLLCLDT